MILRLVCVDLLILASAAMADAPADPPATQPSSQLALMHFDKTPPQEAFARLAKEAGATVSFDRADAAAFWAAHANPITCDISPMTYWEALQELCVAAKVSARRSRDGEIVLEEPVPVENRQFAVVHGLVQIELYAMLSSRTMTFFNSPATNSQCQLVFRGRAPVGLHPVWNEPIKITALTDQDGKPIKVISQPPQSGWSEDGMTQPYLFLDRGPKLQRIGRVAGEVVIGLRGHPVTLEIDDIRKGHVKRELSGLEFDVTPRLAEGVCDVEINVKMKGDRAGWPTMRGNLMSSFPDLVDAKGEYYQRADARGMGGSDFHLTAHFRRFPGNPNGVGDPQKLIWKFSSSGPVLKVPFEFKDVPLSP